MLIEFLGAKLLNELPEEFRKLGRDKYNKAIKTLVNNNYREISVKLSQLLW